MPIPKQGLSIPIALGMDTKTDVRQLSPGVFPLLTNVLYDTDKLLKKRNGFGELTELGVAPNTLTTFNDALLALTESALYSYSSTAKTWANKGTFISAHLETQAVVRSATSQGQQDAAIDEDGLACIVWLDSDGSSKYQIVDSTTGNIVVGATTLLGTGSVATGQARVFVLGNYFVITFTATVSAAAHLQYITIPRTAPTSPSSPDDFATDLLSVTTGYDCAINNGIMYIAYTQAGPNVQMLLMTSQLVKSAKSTIAGRTATYMSVTADTTNNNIWLTYWDTTNSNLYGAAFDGSRNVVLASTVLKNSSSIVAVTATATGGHLLAFYQNHATYGYTLAGASAAAVTDFVSTVACTSAGVVSGDAVLLRGVALASKAFIASSTTYVLLAYGSNSVNNNNYQPTYFLVNSSGSVVGRVAYSNGGGYPASQVLANANVFGSEIVIAYLLKDLITPVNKTMGSTQVAGIYSQTGINLASFTLDPQQVADAEIGNNLHMTGSMLWMYDGAKPVEHGFNVWPEDVFVGGISTVGGLTAQEHFYQATYEWTDAQGNIHRSAPSVPVSYTITAAPVSFTANRTSGSAVLASVSSLTGLQVGQAISGTGVPAATFILSIDSPTQITMSANATSGSATSTTITPVTLSSLVVKIPYYRLTYKTSNKVRLVVYRWSTASPVFYQVTSVTSPQLNVTSSDSLSYTDSAADAAILGNQIIYTNGGVVENICAPACSDIALFRSRAVLIDSEDPNLLWFSKQVIQGVPVETSDLFTIFVSPTIGAQGSTGDCKCVAGMDDKLIIFKKDALYYMTGTGPDNTGAQNDFSEPQFITATVGCENVQSIVFIPSGLMFQSDKGIWLLGRDLSTTYIGAAVDAYKDDLVLSAINIPGTNQVRFTLDSGATLMYDYFYNRWAVFSGITGVTSTLFEGLHTYADSEGTIFQETPGLYLDGSSPVLISLTTGWLNLAGLQGYQRAFYALLLGQFITPHKLSVGIAYDYNPAIVDQAIVIPDNFSQPFGDDNGSFGDIGPYGGPGNVEDPRIFFSHQRSQAIQMTIQELYDPSYGIAAGAGLTLSGLNIVAGAKKTYRTSAASKSFAAGNGQ